MDRKTVILTKNGPRPISELIEKPCDVFIHGKLQHCPRGFVSLGTKSIVGIVTTAGYRLNVAEDQAILMALDTETTMYVKAADLKSGMSIPLFHEDVSLQYTNSPVGIMDTQNAKDMLACLDAPNSDDVPKMLALMLNYAVVMKPDETGNHALHIECGGMAERLRFQRYLIMTQGIVSETDETMPFDVVLKDQHAKRYLDKCDTFLMSVTVPQNVREGLVKVAQNKTVSLSDRTTISHLGVLPEEEVYTISLMHGSCDHVVANGMLAPVLMFHDLD
jgi:hypothetical protein